MRRSDRGRVGEAMTTLELFEYAFRDWLETYMRETEYWHRLSLRDIDVLTAEAWKDFVNKWQEIYSGNRELGA